MPRPTDAALRIAAALLLVAASASCVAQRPTRAYPLPTDGPRRAWDTTEVVFTGKFTADLTAKGACAWLGPGKLVDLWPAGWSVRFHPTELLDARGRVLAKQGEHAEFHGYAVRPWPGVTQRCGDPKNVVNVMVGAVGPG